MSSELSFCEPVWATTSSLEHIRLLDGPRRLGGGIEGVALCGFDLARGWDIQGDVTAERIRRGIGAHANPTCPVCGSLALALLNERTAS